MTGQAGGPGGCFGVDLRWDSNKSRSDRVRKRNARRRRNGWEGSNGGNIFR